jgi:hypothetical protein
MIGKRNGLLARVIIVAAALMLVAPLGPRAAKLPAAEGDGSLFSAFAPVLRHPRCQNCHPAGDFPRQDDDRHPHTMNVRRGPGGRGVTAEKCSTCHQESNLPGLHMPPGAPDWHMPPSGTHMIFEGRTDGEICRQIKDPTQNGNRSIDQLVQHMTQDKLIMWIWNPGEGRAPAPTSHDEFAAKVKTWAAAGAPCPKP